jgi:hypothetical protein
MSILKWLGLAFIVLKLTGYIDWSWWYVLSPIYGEFIIIIIQKTIELRR